MQKRIEKIANSLYGDECYDKNHSRIYKIHKYWSRKPWYIVEKYINNYSTVGELVMDPFCGSGCTGLEAVINGRNFIGQDLNPAALRVSSGTLENKLIFEDLENEFKRIENTCKTEIMSLYCSEDFCLKCGKPLYFKNVNIGPKFNDEYSGTIYCQECNSKAIKKSLTIKEIIDMKTANEKLISKWVPTVRFPEKFYKDRFSYKGIHLVTDMYTNRNLYALSILRDAIMETENEKNKRMLELAFSNTVLHVSKLKSENVRPLGVNNYWVPDDFYEENVWFRFQERFKNIIISKKQQEIRENEKKVTVKSIGEWRLDKKSALDSMGIEVIDYFFTDPPYGDAIQYSELSFIWNAWFNESYETEEEVIINPVQSKGANEFQELLGTSLEKIYMALKNDRYFTLCFQNKNSNIWEAVIQKCKQLGFVLRDISIYDTYGSPFNKSWANFSPKADIYVTFQKCTINPEDFYRENETVEGIIKQISYYMQEHQINKDNNKLYDLTIAYLIWAMYYNLSGLDVKGFDIKKFTKLAENVLS